MTEPIGEDLDVPYLEQLEAPVHGFRGEVPRYPGIPQALTIAISREAGARGASIGVRVGAKLQWQVYSQDLLEFLSQDESFPKQMLEQVSPEASQWADEELRRLSQSESVVGNPSVLALARTVLALGAQGEFVLLGRGAGYLLPRHATLHVRLVAPLEDRIAYMAQHLRLTEDEAREQVRKRDHRRAEFIFHHFHLKPSDVHAYDLVLNTSLLGEELCCDLIVQAAKAKLKTLK